MKNKQHGITLISFILVMMVVIFFAMIAIRLVPIYSEYFSVVGAMKNVARQPDAANKKLSELQVALQKSFQIEYVDSVKDDNIKLITDNGRQLNVNYEVRKKFVYNVDFVVTFDYTVDLNNTASSE